MKQALILTLFISLVVACAQVTDQPESKEAVKKKQDSELALLMREIHVDSKEWRKAIIEERFEGDTIAMYEALTQSQPTNPDVGGPAFEGFAAYYQSALDSLMLVRSIEAAPEAYNNLVSACIQCHQEYCPGPVKTIKKLYISEAISGKAQ
jgi:hypothetical protein